MLPRYFGIYHSNMDLSFWREPHGASLIIIIIIIMEPLPIFIMEKGGAQLGLEFW
jgi:hypothetical protein